jgi:hypothetical protein
MGRKARKLQLKRNRDFGWGLFQILLGIVLTALIASTVAIVPGRPGIARTDETAPKILR